MLHQGCSATNAAAMNGKIFIVRRGIVIYLKAKAASRRCIAVIAIMMRQVFQCQGSDATITIPAKYCF
jgi:hypothetical protein